jgi:dolichol kinase
VLTSDWCILAHAGIVFLGIGDSAAAVMGSQYGKRKWRAGSGKTQEGSMWLVISVCVVYLLIVLIIDHDQIMIYACIVFATIPAAIAEGTTR